MQDKLTLNGLMVRNGFCWEHLKRVDSGVPRLGDNPIINAMPLSGTCSLLGTWGSLALHKIAHNRWHDIIHVSYFYSAMWAIQAVLLKSTISIIVLLLYDVAKGAKGCLPSTSK